MALNTTLAERRSQSARDLNSKLKLERRTIIELRELFGNMADDLGLFYLATGAIPNADTYLAELTGIVTRQYARAEREFSGQLVAFLRNNPDGKATSLLNELGIIATGRSITVAQLITEIEATSKTKFQEFAKINVAQDVKNINATNQKMLDASVAKAKATLTEDLEREPTRQEVARKAKTNARNAGFNRAGSIATTGTQKAAEATKDFEREALFSTRNSLESRIQGLVPLQPKVIWMTIGDNLVRGSHLEADFQEREGGTFTVQGQLLRFPGDTELGATASNVINCRCNALTIIED